MRRRKRRRTAGAGINLDSLMDIMTCSVGILLFVVLFSVLEFRGTALPLSLPLAQDPPEGTVTTIAICDNGQVKLFEFDRCLDEVLDGLDRQTMGSIGGWVARANAKQVQDQNFVYGINYDTETDYYYGFSYSYVSQLDLVIKERPDLPWTTLEQLEEPSSTFATQLQALDPAKTWVSFALDSTSLDTFRAARLVARDHGFATGWTPLELTFPFTMPLLGSYRSEAIGPKSGINIRQ